MKRIAIGLALTSLMLMLFTGCAEDVLDSVYDPDAPSAPAPVITSVIPTDSAYAGVGEITIMGDNFSTNKEHNLVYFSAELAEVLSATTTQLVVKTPVLISDTINIKIAVRGAELFSSAIPYRLKPAVVQFGKLEDPGQSTVFAWGITADAAGNVLVSTERNKIKKIAPDGKTSTLVSAASFLRAVAMRMGPGNLLYTASATGRVRRISTFTPEGTEALFASLTANPQDFDFDANLNLWVAAGPDLYLIKPDKSVTKVLTVPVSPVTVRVYNGYLYFAGKSETTAEEKIWRSEIQGQNLGTPEVVLDVAAAAWLQGASVLCLTFAQDGELYLGTNHAEGMFVVPAGDEGRVLFPGLVTGGQIYAMSWGEGRSLFVVQQTGTTSKVLRLEVGKLSAPYYGRR